MPFVLLGTTAMFAPRVPEKMIKEVTDHKSSKALALYERPTLAQKQVLSKVPAGGPRSSSSTSFSEEVDKLKPNYTEVKGLIIMYMQSQLFLLVCFLPCFMEFPIAPATLHQNYQHWSWPWWRCQRWGNG